ncbi:26S proteasome non-ATPase regulatory subunit [Nesidiocoris tenuis]|nr:26S proteasome non-ATPase regulatory subunit [Nesidiocoris tenuis]
MNARRGATDARVPGRGWGLLGAAALVVVFLGAANGGLVRYDQSQTGDYNVHVDMKNVDILAFLDDSASFGEYDYDYGEMTLKPPAPPHSQHNSSLPAQPPTDVSSTEKAEDSSNPSPADGPPSTTTAPPTARPTRRCGAGFFRDPMGRCRRQRKPIRLSGILNQAKNTISG